MIFLLSGCGGGGGGGENTDVGGDAGNGNNNVATDSPPDTTDDTTVGRVYTDSNGMTLYTFVKVNNVLGQSIFLSSKEFTK